MGRGRSGLSKKSGGGNAAPAKANTPSGIDFNQFMSMPDDKKYSTLNDIINNPNSVVPSYLDKSDTSKVIYALGMTNKPNVVSDDQLDKMPGKDLYRTVCDAPSPPPNSKDILDQIATGDYTQMPGSGGSAYGRAIYFAENDFAGSRSYGNRGKNAIMMRAKVNPNANIISESALDSQMKRDSKFMNSVKPTRGADIRALYALSHGIDGWRADYGSYRMIVNRGALTVGSTYKHTQTPAKTPTGRIKKRYGQTVMKPALNWKTADDVK